MVSNYKLFLVFRFKCSILFAHMENQFTLHTHLLAGLCGGFNQGPFGMVTRNHAGLKEGLGVAPNAAATSVQSSSP